MQSPENQVSGFGRLDRDGDSLQVAHLAHHDHIGIFPKSGTQRLLEGLGMEPDLPLGHDALLRRMDELDRVFDGQDVIGTGTVDQVHQCRKRRRLAGAGRARDQDQSLRQVAEFLNLGRDAELLHGLNPGGNDPEDAHRAAALHRRVGAEPRGVRKLIRPVRVTSPAEFVELSRGHDAGQHRLYFLGAELWALVTLQFAVAAEDGRFTGAQVQIARTSFYSSAEQSFHAYARVRGRLCSERGRDVRLRRGSGLGRCRSRTVS